MKYRFLGHPNAVYYIHPITNKVLYKLEHGKIYTLRVVTAFWSKKPRIIRPFYCPYQSWKTFYYNWRPITLGMRRLEGIDKKAKVRNNEVKP